MEWQPFPGGGERPSPAKMESQLLPIHCLLKNQAERRRQSLIIGKAFILYIW